MNSGTFVRQPIPFRLLLLTGLVAVTMAATQPAVAAASHQCVTVRVDAPFRLPDGLLYPAGPLTLCDSRTFSPVDNLHKILVGGSSVGLFISRRRSAEVRLLDSPEFVFMHGTDGNLELVGYTMRKAGRSTAYRLKSSGMTPLQAHAPRPLGGVASGPVAAVVATSGTH